MSDNVFQFPKKPLDIQVDLEEEAMHDQLVEAVHTMLEMHVAGIIGTSDVGWEHVMDAAMSLGISAGLRAGIPAGELEDALADVVIEEVYDA